MVDQQQAHCDGGCEWRCDRAQGGHSDDYRDGDGRHGCPREVHCQGTENGQVADYQRRGKTRRRTVHDHQGDDSAQGCRESEGYLLAQLPRERRDDFDQRRADHEERDRNHDGNGERRQRGKQHNFRNVDACHLPQDDETHLDGSQQLD